MRETTLRVQVRGVVIVGADAAAAAAGVAGLSLSDVTVRFDGLLALRGLSIRFESGLVHGIIGPNGAGKTTLLNVISGFQARHSGTVTYEGRQLNDLGVNQRARIGLIRSFQTVRLMENESVRDNVLLGRFRFPQSPLYAQLLGLRSQRESQAASRDALANLTEIMPQLASILERPVAGLPFGSKRLVEIARVLAAEPDVVMLDEPAAGLQPDERVSLSSLVRDYSERFEAMVLLVEHDVELVRHTCDRLVVMDSGNLLAEGLPNEVLHSPKVQQVYFGNE